MSRPAGAVRDCGHKYARHEHGTRNAYVLDRCRCQPCRDANAAAENARTRAKLYGRYDRYVEAEPVREHIRALSVSGIGLKTITNLTGVSGGQLCSIMYGRARRSTTPRRPQRRVTTTVAQRILAIPLNTPPAPHVPVDATGTHRRLQALVTLGWSQSKLADRLGMARANFGKMMLGERVLACTADAVRALYDELWNTAPPRETHRDRIAYTRALNLARERGWLPPLAWDDDTIDDPAFAPVFDAEPELDEIAVERAMRGDPPVRLGKPEREEAVRRLTELGYSARAIAERLHTAHTRVVTRDRASSRGRAA